MVIEIIKYTSIPIIYEPVINLYQTFIFVGNGIVLDSNFSICTFLLLNGVKSKERKREREKEVPTAVLLAKLYTARQ